EEVGSAVCGYYRSDREAFVDGVRIRVLRARMRYVNGRIPSGDHAVLAGEEEARGSRRPSVRDREVGRSVDDRPGRCTAGDVVDERSGGRGRKCIAGAVVERRDVQPIVGYPDRARRGRGQPPGVDEV